MSDMGLESPDADSAEQDQDAFPDTAEMQDSVETPLEANQADAAEQARELGADDEEYR
jgi:hypothetical protein